jgi:hypothetical protein
MRPASLFIPTWLRIKHTGSQAACIADAAAVLADSNPVDVVVLDLVVVASASM